MHFKKLAVMPLLLSGLYCISAYSQEFSDDCQVDLDDVGIQVKMMEESKEGGGTNLTLMYSNKSANHYELPVISVKSCSFAGGGVLLPEITGIDAESSVSQAYRCGASFDANNIAVKMYVKADGDETATSACATISPASQQPAQQASEPPIAIKALATSNSNIAGQKTYRVEIVSLVPEVAINHVLINRNEKCNDNDYIEKAMLGRVKTKFKMGEQKTITTVCNPVEIAVKTNQGDFTFKFR